MKFSSLTTALLSSTAIATSALASSNLLVNPTFTGGSRAGWIDRTSKKQEVSILPAQGLPEKPNALNIKITKDGGKSHGQLIQFVKVRPNVDYSVSAMIQADVDKIAYLQIKEMRGKSEGKRHKTPENKLANTWERVEKQITTAPDTTHLQILLRYRMNSALIGKTIQFAQPTLTSADGKDVAPKPYVPPKAKDPIIAPAGIDAYVTPFGSGTQDGSSWENAFAIKDGGLQKAWNKAGPGNTVYLAGGNYSAASLQITAGGASLEKPIKLIGIDRGTPDFPRPVFTGSWKPTAPEKGPTFISIAPNAGFITIENIELKNYNRAVVAKGSNHGLRIKKVDIQYCRDAFWLDGGATPALPDSGSKDIIMDCCNVTFYTKRTLRTLNGVQHLQVLNCTANAGGKEFSHETFPVGYHILGGKKGSGVYDKNITFVNCEGSHNWHDAGSKYWNADGFAAERNVKDITFINCRAFGNTDGGWDVKSTRPRWENCVSIGNKRNYRVWNQPAGEKTIFKNCLSAYSHDFGGLEHDRGFWLGAGSETVFENCTSWEDRLPIANEGKDPEQVSKIELIRSLIADNGQPRKLRLDGKVELINTESILPGEGSFKLKSPAPTRTSPGDAFNCTSHPDRGYVTK